MREGQTGKVLYGYLLKWGGSRFEYNRVHTTLRRFGFKLEYSSDLKARVLLNA